MANLTRFYNDGDIFDNGIIEKSIIFQDALFAFLRNIVRDRIAAISIGNEEEFDELIKTYLEEKTKILQDFAKDHAHWDFKKALEFIHAD